MTDQATGQKEIGREIGRNEPCPCGSGKKYKRCHGVDAAPKVTSPKPASDNAGAPAGFDPQALMAGMDQQWMAQFAQAMQRLPRGQLQRLQSIMQKAMSGKDVSKEAAEFERTLPVGFQTLLRNFQMPTGVMDSMGGAGALPVAEGETAPAMSTDEARKIVEQAMAEGKISKEQAADLLEAQAAESSSAPSSPAETEKKSGIGKLWRSLTGKN